MNGLDAFSLGASWCLPVEIKTVHVCSGGCTCCGYIYIYTTSTSTIDLQRSKIREANRSREHFRMGRYAHEDH
jgi:hypothetical protein